jgi:hypothetical protein
MTINIRIDLSQANPDEKAHFVAPNLVNTLTALRATAATSGAAIEVLGAYPRVIHVVQRREDITADMSPLLDNIENTLSSWG